MKKAASSEKRAMREDIAYRGTLRLSAGRTDLQGGVDLHDHDPYHCPLEGRLAVVLQLQRDRHDRDSGGCNTSAFGPWSRSAIPGLLPSAPFKSVYCRVSFPPPRSRSTDRDHAQQRNGLPTAVNAPQHASNQIGRWSPEPPMGSPRSIPSLPA